jgi:hypothetical protein
MKFKLSYFLSPLFLLVFIIEVNGQLQSVIAATGGDFSEGQVFVSFTLGEVGILTVGKEDMVVTQGFHQPKLVVIPINEVEGLAIEIQAYPNPVSEYLNVVSSEILPAGSSYRLYSINGGLVEEKLLEGTTTKVEFQSLVSATYVLKVVQNSQTIKSFKIIKQ